MNDEDEENDHGAVPHLERRDGRPCSRSSTVRRERENSPLLGSPFL